MREIISSYNAFREKFQEISSANPEHKRLTALKVYFKKGGVVSAVSRGGGWPKLIYPNDSKLQRQIDELTKHWQLFEGKKKDWEKTFFSARTYNIRNKVMKFFDGLYWRHILKSMADSDYRKDAEAVQLPVQMVAEPKYRPMINMFVKDFEYRKQLTETVQKSIVYKKDKRVARYAQELRAFRLDTSNKNISHWKKKADEVKVKLGALQEILRWSKER